MQHAGFSCQSKGQAADKAATFFCLGNCEAFTCLQDLPVLTPSQEGFARLSWFAIVSVIDLRSVHSVRLY